MWHRIILNKDFHRVEDINISKLYNKVENRKHPECQLKTDCFEHIEKHFHTLFLFFLSLFKLKNVFVFNIFETLNNIIEFFVRYFAIY